MTLTFLDLYNSAASQEWSKYDNDAVKTDEFEQSLVINLNKAIAEILYSYPFPFRERTQVLVTLPKVNSYQMPKGLILKNNENNYCVKINSQYLSRIAERSSIDTKLGIPEGFYISGQKIVLYPTPSEKFVLAIDYLTLAIGEDSSGEELFSLKKDNDIILIPPYLEEIFKNAVISRSMLYSISSESDENYSSYKKQSEISYKQLIKYAKGVELDKKISI